MIHNCSDIFLLHEFEKKGFKSPELPWHSSEHQYCPDYSTNVQNMTIGFLVIFWTSNFPWFLVMFRTSNRDAQIMTKDPGHIPNIKLRCPERDQDFLLGSRHHWHRSGHQWHYLGHHWHHSGHPFIWKLDVPIMTRIVGHMPDMEYWCPKHGQESWSYPKHHE